MEEIKASDALRAKKVLKAYCKQFNLCEGGCVFVKHDYDPYSDSSRCSLCCPPYTYGDPWRRLHDMRKDDEPSVTLEDISTEINAAKGVLANHKECLSELDGRLVKCEGDFENIKSLNKRVDWIEAYHEHRMAGIEKKVNTIFEEYEEFLNKVNKIYEEYEEFLELEDDCDEEVNPRSLV